MKLNKKGFTLVELIAAVAIVTILTVVAVPNVLNSLKEGKEASYQILVEDIVTASKSLYEELYSNEVLGVAGTPLYQYYDNGCPKNEPITIDELNSTIKTNLQTLVSNGYLDGTNMKNDNDADDSSCPGEKNQKIILNPKEDNQNIGFCLITITKNIGNNSKVTYTVESNTENEACPKTTDYAKGVS